MARSKDGFPALPARDREDVAWRDEPVRRDARMGSTLYYLGFSHLGFTVRLLLEDGTWGDPIGLSKERMRATTAGRLPAGVAPPC